MRGSRATVSHCFRLSTTSVSVSPSSELLVAHGGGGLAAISAPAADITDADEQRARRAFGADCELRRCSAESDASAWIVGRLDDLEALARDLGQPETSTQER